MDKTTEMINHCEEYTNFIAKAFCEGGTAMYFIAIVGFLVVALILERMVSLQKLTIDKSSVSKNIFSMIMQGQIQQAMALCDATPTPLTNTMKAGLVQVFNRRPDEEVQVAMDASVLRETPRLEGWTSFLAVFGNVSVLIGLLGTIIGLIKSFSGVAEADAATKAAHLSKGISEALNCTALDYWFPLLPLRLMDFFKFVLVVPLTICWKAQ